MYDYIIIGAGFAGSVIARKVAEQLNKKVLVIDRRDHIGGNCFDLVDDNGVRIHKYGPHLFHTNNKKVVDFLSQFTSWQEYHHEVLASIDGKKVPIPFNINTLYKVFDEEQAKSIELKLYAKYEENSKVPILELKKSDDKDLSILADFVYEKIFVNYTAKQWGMNPEDLDSAVTARVPIFVGYDNRYFNDQYQMVPTYGYTTLFENMLNHKNITVQTGTEYKEVCKLKEGVIYYKDVALKGKLIFTGQIDELFDYQFGELAYRSVDMKFETVQQEYYQEKAVVNYPNEFDFTRITEFKHIHPCKEVRTTILKEYPKTYKKNRGDTPYYPVFTSSNQEKYEEYKQLAQSIDNLILVGRLAEYKYYDMDDIVQRALEVFEQQLIN